MTIFSNNPNLSCGNLCYETFVSYLRYYAQEYMKHINCFHPYVIDEHNKGIIDNLFHWTRRSSQGEYNPDKGIYLCGKIGCGKTILMKGFLETLMAASGYYIPFYQASLLHIEYKKKGIDSLKKNPIFIDELGREQLELYIDGVRIRPIEDLVAMRYEFGAMTFFTSNFKIETLSQGYDDNGKKIGYGAYIGDRIKEMCNIVVMTGNSRRNV